MTEPEPSVTQNTDPIPGSGGTVAIPMWALREHARMPHDRYRISCRGHVSDDGDRVDITCEECGGLIYTDAVRHDPCAKPDIIYPIG